MSDAPRSPLQRLADLWFYAPVGLALRPDQAIEDLAKTGREQVALARLIGQFAVDQGRKRFDDVAGQLPIAESLSVLAEGFGLKLPEPVTPAEPDPSSNGRATAGSPTTNGASATATGGPTTASDDTAAAEPDPTPDDATATIDDGPVPAADELAIPGYESLAASHVVRRLAGLDPNELDAVRRYEIANRNRRTVLGRIAQLQTSRDGDGS
ncbi:MAG: hypothetical protein S0880_12435 [Actinomycetota bacterium]|nr:hypothetical protein [Actinomycetota bacterium]